MRILVALLAVAPFVALIVGMLTGRAVVSACCARPVEGAAKQAPAQVVASGAPAVAPSTRRTRPLTEPEVARS